MGVFDSMRGRRGECSYNLFVIIYRGCREVGSIRVAYLTSRCDGGADASVCANTCGDNGNSRSLLNHKIRAAI